MDPSSGPYSRSARSHTRCRFSRRTTATSPMTDSSSSIRGTWFDPYQPLSLLRCTTLVSGISDASSGPSARSRASTSLRKAAFASRYSRDAARSCRARINATMSGIRLDAKNRPSNSNSRRSSSTAFLSCPGSYPHPIRLQNAVCSAGAIVTVGSILMLPSCSATSTTSPGRSASSNWARTAIRRASSRVRRCMPRAYRSAPTPMQPAQWAPRTMYFSGARTPSNPNCAYSPCASAVASMIRRTPSGSTSATIPAMSAFPMP